MAVDKMTLKMRQAMPLEDKIRFTKRRIQEWIDFYGVDGCYVSFSGGKDSTVLLDIARQVEPNIKAMFVDTGLEYPQIKEFVKSINNVDIIRPKMMFNKVIEKYGFPIISKEVSLYLYQMQLPQTEKNLKTRNLRMYGIRSDGVQVLTGKIPEKWKYLIDAPFKISNKCCDIMKKKPSHDYDKQTGRVPIIGTMSDESRVRQVQYLKYGCNAFNKSKPQSTPIAFWTEQDVLEYLVKYNVPYASVYGEIKQDENGKWYTTGCQRTGCMFCGYGCHLEKEPNRFQMLQKTHPKQYDYIINKLGFGEVLDYIGVKYTNEEDETKL